LSRLSKVGEHDEDDYSKQTLLTEGKLRTMWLKKNKLRVHEGESKHNRDINIKSLAIILCSHLVSL